MTWTPRVSDSLGRYLHGGRWRMRRSLHRLLTSEDVYMQREQGSAVLWPFMRDGKKQSPSGAPSVCSRAS
jgi:hypothetical protein